MFLVAVAVVLLCHQVVLGDVPPFQISKASNSFANRFYEVGTEFKHIL